MNTITPPEKSAPSNLGSNSTEMTDLLKVPFEQRDLDWEEKFFVEFTKSNVRVISPDPQQGPDGWPYLICESVPEGEAGESVQKILHWLSTRGIGLVFNPHQEYPDFVFSFGMVWHFRQTGLFYKRQKDIKSGVVTLTEGQKITAGAPTEEYLPDAVRKILKDFFRDQGLYQVKILMMSENGEHYDLVFSLDSMGNPQETEHQGIAEAISWFLPPHYSLLLAKEEGLPAFYDL